MAENKGGKLEFGVGFNVDNDTAVEKLQEQLNKMNNSTKTTAEGFDSIEKALKKIIESQGNFSKSTEGSTGTAKSLSKEIKDNWVSGIKDSQNSIKVLKERFNELNNEVRNSKKNSDMSKQVAEMAKIKTTIDTISRSTKAISFEKWKSGISTSQQALTELERQIQSVKKDISSNKSKDGIISEYALNESTKQLSKLQSQFSKIQSTVSKAASKESGDFKSAYDKMASYSKQSMESRVANLNQEAQVAKQTSKEQSNAYRKSASDSNKVARETNKILSEDVNGSLNNFKRGLISASLEVIGLRQLVYAFQNLGSEIVEVNYNVINNQRLMGDYSDTLRDKLNNSAIEMAKQTGIQVTDAQQIQGAWIRINDKYAESEELLNKISLATAKFMNVGEIDNADDAVKLVNSTMLQFNLSVDDGVQALNKWAYMADKTALGTADEYGEALSKMGGFMSSLGGDMDDAMVMTSICGDRLAKSGEEAGNSLKTILSYLTRTKTTTLFDQIAQETGDASLSLKDTEGNFKDFSDLMTSASKAYTTAISTGNDQMAKSIQEAIGATRQGDVAITLLKNWSTDAPKYYQMINDSVSGEQSYLDEQNKALMQSFKNQWNALYSSIVGLGTVIANAGLLESLTGIMGAIQNISGWLSKVNPKIIRSITIATELGIAVIALKKIGNVSGLFEKFNKILSQGSNIQRKATKEITDGVNAYFDYADSLEQAGKLESTNTAKLQLTREAYKKYNDMYNKGAITVTQYQKALGVLKGNLAELGVTETELAVKKEIENVAQESGIELSKAETAATNKQTLAMKAQIAASNGFSAIKTTLQSLFTSKNIFVAAVIAVGATIIHVFNKMKNATEDQAKATDDAKNKLNDYKSQIEELESKSASGQLTDNERKKLEYLKKQVEYQQQLYSIEQKRLTHDQVFGANSVDGSYVKDAEKSISAIKDLNTELDKQGKILEGNTSAKAAAQNKLNDYKDTTNSLTKSTSFLGDTMIKTNGDITQNGVAAQEASDKMEKGYNSVNYELTKLKKTRDDMQNAIDSGDLSDKEVEEAQKKIDYYDDFIYKQEQLTKASDGTTSSIQKQQSKIDSLTSTLKDTSDSVDALNGYFDEYNKQGYLSMETVSKMLQDHPDYAGYLVKEGDQYKLNTKALDDLNASKEEQAKETEDLISAQNGELSSTDKLTDNYQQAIKKSDEFLDSLKKSYPELSEFSDNLKSVNSDFLSGKTSIDQYKDSIGALIKKNDFSKVKEDCKNLTDEEKQSAESQQAMFASLTNNVGQMFEENTVELKNGSIGVQEYVENLIGCDQQLLDMRVKTEGLAQDSEGVWKNAAGAADDYANKLQKGIDALNGMMPAIQVVTDNQSMLEEISTHTANTVSDSSWFAQLQSTEAYQTMYSNMSGALASMYDNNLGAWTAITNDIAGSMGCSVDNIFASNGAIKDGVQLNAAAMSAGTESMTKQLAASVNDASCAGAKCLDDFATMIKKFSFKISAKPYGGVKVNLGNIMKGKNPFEFSSFGLELTGEGDANVSQFASDLSNFSTKIEQEDLSKYINLDSFTPKYTPKTYSGSNYTPAPITNTSSSGGGSSYTPSSDSSSSSSGSSSHTYSSGKTAEEKAAEAAQTAAEKAAKASAKANEKSAKEAQEAAEAAQKAAEEAKKAIENYKSTYTSNVESFYSKVISTLKTKYQSLYDERKKQLEAEKKAELDIHNAKVTQYQKELDALDGNTIEDKEAKLVKLKNQLEDWKSDDSSLGKSKQKDLTSQISDLETDIKKDQIQAKIDAENTTIDNINDKYDKLTDSSSDGYDTVLASLDKKMTDKALADESADLIRNNKLQEIVDMFGNYAPDYDNISYLMGSTIGEIVGKQVASAMANYGDLKDNTITSTGGEKTNAVDGKAPTTNFTGNDNHVKDDYNKLDGVKDNKKQEAKQEKDLKQSSKDTVTTYKKLKNNVDDQTNALELSTTKNFKETDKKATDIFTDLKDTVTELAKQTNKATTEQFTEQKTKTDEIFDTLQKDSKSKWTDICVNTILKIVDKLVADTPSRWTKMDSDAKSWWTTTLGNSNSLWTQIKTTILQRVDDTNAALPPRWAAMVTEANTEMSTLRDDVIARTDEATEHIKTLPPEWNKVGVDMIQNFDAGIKSTDITKTVKEIVDKTVQAFVDGFVIHSPSHVMRDIGGYVIQGFINGLSKSNLFKVCDGLMRRVKNLFSQGFLPNLAGIKDLYGDNFDQVRGWLEENLGISFANLDLETALQIFGNLMDDDSHGYSQSDRWGPDYDCSSSIIYALRTAGLDTGGASTTYNMSDELTSRGWERLPVPADAPNGLQRGDIVLNDAQHVEWWLGNALGGFHSDYDGRTGDSSGTEANRGAYYDDGWNAILRYVGGVSGGGHYSGDGNVEQWILQALDILGMSHGYLGMLENMVAGESGGDPNAINNWDSNAQAGHPSKGLMQTIDSTFQAYMLPGHGNIWNPVDNMLASIRYQLARYGTIVGHAGYKIGSRYIPEDMIAMLHEGEAVIPKGEMEQINKLSNPSNPYVNSGGNVIPQNLLDTLSNISSTDYSKSLDSILSAEQTGSFDADSFNKLPKINGDLTNTSVETTNSSSVTFNRELVSVHIDKVSGTDVDSKKVETDLNNMVKKGLRKSGLNIPKI